MSKYPEHTTDEERARVDAEVRARLAEAEAKAKRQPPQRSSQPDDGAPGYPIGGHKNGRP